MDSMKKRTFISIRNEILSALGNEPKSITRIANETGMTWKTAQRHLVWLEKMENKVKIIKHTKRKIIYAKRGE